MSDIFELTLSVHLADGLPERELAELRWHLGVADRPDHLAPAAHPHPLLDSVGELTAQPTGGWSLTAHLPVHPDEFESLGRLLLALARATGTGGPVVIGQLRSPDSALAEPLLVRRDTVDWPA